MTADELKALLQALYDDRNNIGVCIYALIKDETNHGPHKLDIEAEAENGLKELFIQSLREKISNKEGLCVLNLSAADERANAIYIYDLEIPEELAVLDTIATRDDHPLLNLNDYSLSLINALIIEIGNNRHQVVLYKTMAPVNIFVRSNFFSISHESRLKMISEEFLRISAAFQMMRIGGELLVLNLEALEKSFGFHDVIKREALQGIAAIQSAGFLTNPVILQELVEEVKYARRLTKVAKSSPVIKAGITGKALVNFCDTHSATKGRMRFNREKDQITLDTKVSKDLFFKILMDDLLTSELTKLHYASVAKDAIPTEA